MFLPYHRVCQKIIRDCNFGKKSENYFSHIALPLDSDDDVSENVQSSCTGSVAENTKSGSFTNGIKKRKKSNVEKSLDVVFQKLQENTKDDFLR